MNSMNSMDADLASAPRLWHPVATDAEVTDEPLAVMLLGEPWVVVRLGGRVVAFKDFCPHRLAPLSAGRVVDGTLQCSYHGYRFDPDGRCVDIPALGPGATIPPKARCDPAAAVAERHGLIWVAPESPVAPIISNE
jgi:vanillate O-demethylase monooxygenase subunit